jgi:hypothetical protein
MKKLWASLAIIAVVVGLFLLLLQRNSKPETPGAENRGAEKGSNSPAIHPGAGNVPSVSPPATPENELASNDLALRAASPNPPAGSTGETNETPALPPLTVLDKARVVVGNYRAAFGENPVGTNPEITAALAGKNPKQINFVADSGLRVNEKGEMVDAYGTPFFFHQISGHEMEIRSAGQDRVMWTADDLVTR